MPKQLTSDSRKALHKKLNQKIERADLEMKKLMFNHEIDPETKEITWGPEILERQSEITEKKIKGYREQIENCQLSLRMVHNTGWIAEWREQHMRVSKEQLEKELPEKIKAAKLALENLNTDEEIKAAHRHLDSLELEELNLKLKLKNLTRAKNCNKKDCYGRGYIGFNIMTGEYSFCQCTINTKHYYNVNKSQD